MRAFILRNSSHVRLYLIKSPNSPNTHWKKIKTLTASQLLAMIPRTPVRFDLNQERLLSQYPIPPEDRWSYTERAPHPSVPLPTPTPRPQGHSLRRLTIGQRHGPKPSVPPDSTRLYSHPSLPVCRQEQARTEEPFVRAKHIKGSKERLFIRT